MYEDDSLDDSVMEKHSCLDDPWNGFFPSNRECGVMWVIDLYIISLFVFTNEAGKNWGEEFGYLVE